MPQITNLKLLRHFQATNQLSDVDMANMLDTYRQTYYKAKNGDNVLTRHRIEFLAIVMETTYEELTTVCTDYPNYVLDVEKIKRLIKFNGWSRQELCVVNGRNPNWINHYLSYGQVPQDKTIGLIAKALGVHIYEILLNSDKLYE